MKHEKIRRFHSPLMCLHFWICGKLLQELKAAERGYPPSGINHRPIRADGFRSGSLSARGEGHDCFARHHAATWMDGRYKKDGYSPPRRLSCTRPNGLFGCHPHAVGLSSVIFLDGCFWFCGGFGHAFVKHIRFPEQQLSLTLMDLVCLHPLAFLITLSRDLLSLTINLMNLAI